jgi:hypothetical protein
MQHLPATTSTSDLPAARPLPEKYTVQLFEQLSGQMGGKFLESFGNARAEIMASEWSQGLAGFSRAEISRGVAACRGRRFAPTLGEFAQLCRPCLDPEVAHREAVRGLQARRAGQVGEWSHPAVYRAAVALSWDLRDKPYAAVRNLWAHVLQEEFFRGWGDGIPPAPIAITRQEPTPADPAVARRFMEMLRPRVAAQ